MNILFLATWFPYPPDNGSKLRVYYLLRALAMSHRMALVSFAFDTARPEQSEDLASFCAAIETVHVDPFAFNRAGALRTFLSPRPMASRPIPAMRQRVAEALHADAFDAIIASTEMMADYVLLAPPHAARILEEHNSMTRWAHERHQIAPGFVQGARRWASWQKGRRYEARVYPRFDLVTMVSDLDRQTTIANTGGKTRVETVPNGVDCSHNRLGLVRPKLASLVFNGSLTYSANYDAMRWFLAQVYPRVRSQVPDVSLTITGSTQGVDFAGLAIDDSVRLTGFVEDVRIPVAEAAVAVAPIRQGGGTRLKILEAMALGTPIAATTKAAEGLDVADGEHLLLADDPEWFADRVATLLQDAALRARLTANARRLVEQRYDWDAIGRRFAALVAETIIQRRARLSASSRDRKRQP